MSGYIYRGTGQDALTPDLAEFAPDYPIPPTTRAHPYTHPPVLSCAAGQHHAITTTDRDGTWFWACLRCAATKAQSTPACPTPGWTTPAQGTP